MMRVKGGAIVCSFGKRLVSIRENKGVSQKGLAELLEISPTRLNYWEKDKRQPDIEMIRKIASVLDVSFVELLDWEERDKEIREGIAFDDYLKSLGYSAMPTEVTKWHYEDENAAIQNRVQIPDEWKRVVFKEGKSVIFSGEEFTDLQTATKDVIETRFYKKLLEEKK
jgi:transcriptional regulator with XRE-family HTH domain